MRSWVGGPGAAIAGLLLRVPLLRDAWAAVRHYGRLGRHVVRCVCRAVVATGRILWGNLRVEAVLAVATFILAGYFSRGASHQAFVSEVKATTLLWFEIVVAFAAAIFAWQLFIAPVRLRREFGSDESGQLLQRRAFDAARDGRAALHLAEKLYEFLARRDEEIQVGERNLVTLARRKEAINARIEDPEDALTRRQFRDAFGVETIKVVEELKEAGFTDERLDRFYSSPKSPDEIREIADRLQLSGERADEEPRRAIVALRRANDSDHSYWRTQILSYGIPLLRRCEKTNPSTPEFTALQNDVRDYVGDHRGAAISKFEAGNDLLSMTDERRLLSGGGPNDLKSVVQRYVALFDEN